MITYFSLCGIICVINAYLMNKKQDEKTVELYKKIDSENFTDIDAKTIVYILCALFGWIILPLGLLRKGYKATTGKELW